MKVVQLAVACCCILLASKQAFAQDDVSDTSDERTQRLFRLNDTYKSKAPDSKDRLQEMKEESSQREFEIREECVELLDEALKESLGLYKRGMVPFDVVSTLQMRRFKMAETKLGPFGWSPFGDPVLVYEMDSLVSISETIEGLVDSRVNAGTATSLDKRRAKINRKLVEVGFEKAFQEHSEFKKRAKDPSVLEFGLPDLDLPELRLPK